MSDSKLPSDSTTDEQLVAYLDGELSPDDLRRISERLANDPDLQSRLQQHQRAWDMLDELPRTNVDDRFTQTTIEMVAVSIADHTDETSRVNRVWSKLVWSVGGILCIGALVIGYAVVASVLHAPNRQLVEDLRVIENLDAYRAAEDIDFLRALEREGLFTAELDGEALAIEELDNDL